MKKCVSALVRVLSGSFLAVLAALLSVSCRYTEEKNILVVPEEIPFASVTASVTDTEGIFLNVTSAGLPVGGMLNLVPTFVGERPSGRYAFVSSDPDIASVSQGGRVEALRAGKADIAVSLEGFSAICSVTVSEPPADDTKPFETVLPSGTQTVDHTAAPTTGTTATPTGSEIVPTGIRFTNLSSSGRLIMSVGQSYQLKAEVFPEGADQTVYFMVGNTRVCTIDPDTGVITATAAQSSWGDGYSEVTVYSKANKEIYTSFMVGIVQRETGVHITAPGSDELRIGDELTLKTTLEPKNVYKSGVTLLWSSDNEEVATVKDGVVTALSAGTVTVTVTGKHSGASDTIVLTVLPDDVPETTPAQTDTAMPADTPVPTDTAMPSDTPAPTDTDTKEPTGVIPDITSPQIG